MATHDASRQTRQRPPRSVLPFRSLAAAALLVAVTSVAYYPALSGGFILDDDSLLTDNPLIKAADGLYRFWCTTEAQDYWPVPSTTLWIEWRLWGMHSAGYHVTNLVLHLVSAGLIWLTLQRLSIPGAFLAALLFAVHPVNVESVAWIAQRKNLLALLFFLLSVLCYLRFESPPGVHGRRAALAVSRWYWLSLGSFVLAMLSKVSVAILPAVLLGIVWWRRPLRMPDLMRLAPFVALAAALLRVNFWFRTHGLDSPIPTVGVTEKLLGAGAVVWFYLSKALLPVNLVFMYPQWHIQPDQWQWWLPLLAALLVSCVLWRYRSGWARPVLLAWGYFCVSLLPVLGFTDVGYQEHLVVADHYQHIALIGVTALLAAGWATWRQRVRGIARRTATAAACAALATLMLLTWRQSRLYVDAMTLYQATLERNPAAAMAHNNLGTIFLEAGRRAEAMAHFEKAVELKPDYADAHNNLGFTLLQEGRPQEARAHLERALQLAPYLAHAYYNMGTVLVQTGRAPEAIPFYQEALRFKPDFFSAHNDLAVTLAQVGRMEEAVVHYQEALHLNPGYPEAHNNLGGALSETGHPQEAIMQFRRALELKPDFPEAQYNLGRLLLQAGQRGEAIERFGRALRLKPDFTDAHNDLGVALANDGRLDEAVGHFREALRLAPDNRDARNNLEETLAMQQQAAAHQR